METILETGNVLETLMRSIEIGGKMMKKQWKMMEKGMSKVDVSNSVSETTSSSGKKTIMSVSWRTRSNKNSTRLFPTLPLVLGLTQRRCDSLLTPRTMTSSWARNGVLIIVLCSIVTPTKSTFGSRKLTTA